ncbi:MAG: YajD family HNH nuclease [Gammaproteobacteria bacterium]|nr:YajD family HNH nuclease [Gammaproteobacteria bacterium]
MASQENSKLDALVANARKSSDEREKGYREQALKLYPWICGRCQREFGRDNLQELTVHHRDHNHDYNPTDGSNWELLCVYCHDNEHSRYIDGVHGSVAGEQKSDAATFNPFAGLKDMLESK